jgi:recombinational DNA repair protein (RecF pathway)
VVTVTARRCQRCGITDQSVTTHSNVDECSRCWNYRKLDLPAAEHWAKVAREFLSNVDVYDIMTFLPTALVGAERVADHGGMLRAARRIMEYSERLIKEGPPHVWREAADQEAETSSNKIN